LLKGCGTNTGTNNGDSDLTEGLKGMQKIEVIPAESSEATMISDDDEIKSFMSLPFIFLNMSAGLAAERFRKKKEEAD